MDSSFWASLLNTIIACGTAGAFIDFYIGRAGQQRVRDWLETWWIKLSYVRWGNFGREEALFAVQVMERLLGRRLLSLRRLYAVLAVGVLSIVVSAVCSYLFSVNGSRLGLSFWASFILSLVLMSISVSITLAAASQVAFVLSNKPALNVVGFISLAALQYVMLCAWPYVTQSMVEFGTAYYRTILFNRPALFYQLHLWLLELVNPPLNPVEFVRNQVRIYVTDFGYLYGHSEFEMRIYNSIALLPNVGRLLLTLIFAGSFMLQPIRRPISTLWARIIESDTPVFTLVFGGAAAIVKAIQEIVKNI